MNSSLVRFTQEIAQGAGKILLKYFEKVHRIEKKRGAGIVTEADRFAEEYLLDRIFKKYPQSSIIAEESGEFKQKGDYCWVIDPLDGTSNYAHAFPWFCVSIGLLIEGVAQVGVIYQPLSQEMFWAQKGGGAHLNKKRIRVSSETKMRDSMVGTGFYYSKGTRLEQEIEVFRAVNQVARAVRRPGSAALDLAFVACGRYDGFWERGLSPWDVAAGFLIVEEAGGRVTNYAGKPTTLHEREVVASNGKIHRNLVSLTRQVTSTKSV